MSIIILKAKKIVIAIIGGIIFLCLTNIGHNFLTMEVKTEKQIQEPIKIESKEIKASIVLTKYEKGYESVICIPSGNSNVPLMPFKNVKQDMYNVVLIYNNKEYCINNKKYYYMCTGKNEKEVNCTLITSYYKDSSSDEEIQINYVYD